jgi:hypothetical protein
MESWNFCRPVIADSHHFDEEQYPDQDPIRIRFGVKTRIRIRIKVMRIRKPDFFYFLENRLDIWLTFTNMENVAGIRCLQ